MPCEMIKQLLAHASEKYLFERIKAQVTSIGTQSL